MTTYLLLILTFLAGYLLGGVPFGWLIARTRGVDILRQGSGNIGATNVGRVLGWRLGGLVFALDFAKGAGPVLAASFLEGWTPDLPPRSLAVAAGVAAFLGHLFPVYLRFRGGKGVATGVGVVAVLTPGLALMVLAAWVVVLAASRFVSLASLASAMLLTGLRLALTPEPWSRDHAVVTAFCLFGTVLVFVRHAANVRRLLAGSENRIKDSPAMLLFSRTVHVLALGLWFGTVVFFTVSALLIFQAFNDVALQGDGDRPPRPLWFPAPKEYRQDRPSDKFPSPLLLEQGNSAAGAAVGRIFPWYYGIQAGCAVVTVITALGWWLSRGGSRVHAVRAVLLTLALAGVSFGWWMERVVAGLRGPRDELTQAVLLIPSPAETAPDLLQQAEQARSDFLRWHTWSLLDNFVVLALVTAAMALAAQMPVPIPAPIADSEKQRASVQ